MSKRTFALLLGLIVFWGAVFRFYKLGAIPVDMSNDEISIAYDAYSLARTGRDEHNNSWPISFQSHGTYKAPLYAYLLAPLTLFLPNTAGVARLPSAVAGVITILTMAGVAYLLTQNRKVALLAATLLAFCPWHIYTSRMALETNVGLLFLSVSVLGWLLFYQKGGLGWAVMGVMTGVLSMYAYHTEWGLFPMIMIGVGVFLWPRKQWWCYLLTGLLAILLLLPLIGDYRGRLGTNARANTEMIWKAPGVVEVIENPNKTIWEKSSVLGNAFINTYFEYHNPSYLFFKGLGLFSPPVFNPGLFLAPLLIPFVIGIFSVGKFTKKRARLFFWWWFVVSPIVPALTFGGTNLVRNLPSLLPYTIVMAIGTLEMWNKYQAKLGRGVWIVALVVYGAFFVTTYYYHLVIYKDAGTHDGYRQAADWVSGHYADYDQIVIDYRFGEYNQFVGVPHLYFAYFTRLDPQKMLARRDSLQGIFFDKYVIRSINWNEKIVPKTLYITPVSNLPTEPVTNLKLVKIIYRPNGSEVFHLYEGNTEVDTKTPSLLRGFLNSRSDSFT